MWTVSGVSNSEEDEKMIGEIRHGADTAWGVGTVDGCWVEEKELVYVVVRGIPEGVWVGEGGGVYGLHRKYPMGDWGQRRPLVIRRAFSKVDVKAEVAHALSATYLVRGSIMRVGLRLGVGLAVSGGGIGVARKVGGPGGPTSRQQDGGSRRTGRREGGGSSVRCYGCGKQGHVRSACPTNGPRCFGCGVIGHLSYSCPGLSLPKMDASGKPVMQVGGHSGGGVPVWKRLGSNSFSGARYPGERREAPQGARANV